MALSPVANAATVKCYTHSCAGPWQVGDTQRWETASFVVRERLTTKEVFITGSLNVTPKTT